MNNLIRKYKIHQLTPVLLKQELEIINFIKDKINNLTEFKDIEYPDSIFYMNSEGEYILEQDDKNERLWVRYKEFWEVLETKYLLEYADIQSLIYYIVEEAFKRKVYTPGNSIGTYFTGVEQTFKRKVYTPYENNCVHAPSVEIRFKQKVSISCRKKSIIFK